MHASVQRLQRWLDHLTGPDEGLERGAVASWVRYVAQDVLPPGAGYSAMPDLIHLQNQLRGQMKYLALRCLSKVLREAFPATNGIHDSPEST